MFDVALGNLDAAREIAAKHRHIWASPPLQFKLQERERAQRLTMLVGLLDAGDRAGLAALLHEWEATTVKNLKIEHLWERTPFPLEEMATS